MSNNPIGLTSSSLNLSSPLPPPSPMVGANVRPMHLVTDGAGCGYQQSPFWAPDAADKYSCSSCSFGVDANKALKYGKSSSCGGQMGPAAMCGQNPCQLSTRSIDQAFEDISASSMLNSVYMSDSLTPMSLSSTKGSYGYSLRSAPCPTGKQQELLMGTIGENALVGTSRFFVGP